MMAVPPDIPAAVPDKAPIVAMEALPLVHVPPVVASLSVVVLPWQTVFVPVIAGGGGRTVNVAVMLQPVAVV